MGKDKSWKLENTLKIDDEQLKTPKHDELCMWAYENMEKILINSIKQLRNQNVYIYKKNTPIKIFMEKSIRNNGFVIGIPDFMVLFNWYKYEPKVLPTHYGCGAIIEIKPEIKSLGEVMRQMQLYKSYRPNLSRIDLGNNSGIDLSTTSDSFHIIVTGTKNYEKYFVEQEIGYFVL